MIKFIETESGTVVAGAGSGGASCGLMNRGSVWEDEKVLEMEGGDGCIIT